jgi:two-component system LytT family response regulator
MSLRESAADLQRPPRATAPSIASLWLGGSVLLWALYAFVFLGTAGDAPVFAAAHALANVLSLCVLAIAIRAILKAEVMRRATPVQALWHGGLAVTFAFAWYAMLIMLLALLRGSVGRGFGVIGFSGPALTWQVFQGLIIYAAIAAVCYAVRGAREAAHVTLVTAPVEAPPLTRYLIRRGEEMTPVEVASIVCIQGAQDCSEVSTLDDRHLVRLSLSEFAARLDASMFIRVHRSAIINLARLDRTEPAGGGRLLAHMVNGETVQVSRAGVQALRRFLV